MISIKVKHAQAFLRAQGRKILLDFYYADPYAPIVKSDNLIVGVERPYNSPGWTRYKEYQDVEFSPMTAALAHALATQEKLKQLNRINVDYFDSDEQLLENRPIDFIAEESVMSKFPINSLLFFLFFAIDKPTKVSVSTNEVHPGLVETLQINNNKLPPISTEDAMGNEEKKDVLFYRLIFDLLAQQQQQQSSSTNDEKLNDTNARRYFAVETSQGYISINRKYEEFFSIFHKKNY